MVRDSLVLDNDEKDVSSFFLRCRFRIKDLPYISSDKMKPVFSPRSEKRRAKRKRRRSKKRGRINEKKEKKNQRFPLVLNFV